MAFIWLLGRKEQPIQTDGHLVFRYTRAYKTIVIMMAICMAWIFVTESNSFANTTFFCALFILSLFACFAILTKKILLTDDLLIIHGFFRKAIRRSDILDCIPSDWNNGYKLILKNGKTTVLSNYITDVDLLQQTLLTHSEKSKANITELI